MHQQQATTFQEAVTRLAEHGITEEQIYLIDLAILAEMAWADSTIQPAEVELLVDYLGDYVQSINRMAGCIVIDEYTAADFVAELIEQRPQAPMLKAIRSSYHAIRLANKTQQEMEAIADMLLSACLDIAASSVTRYPYGLKERFTKEEKAYYLTLQRLLNS